MSSGTNEVEMEDDAAKDGAAADAAAAPKAERRRCCGAGGDKPADPDAVGGDAAADEWASMLDEKAEGGTSERVLNQNEIDNLARLRRSGRRRSGPHGHSGDRQFGAGVL